MQIPRSIDYDVAVTVDCPRHHFSRTVDQLHAHFRIQHYSSPVKAKTLMLGSGRDCFEFLGLHLN
jgi:hypothetical protein